jgi:hypothetical protein
MDLPFRKLHVRATREAVEFTLSEASSVTMSVLDSRGRTVFRLAERVFAPGKHAIPWNGKYRAMSSGIYQVRIHSEAGAENPAQESAALNTRILHLAQ